jgi:hypothetical protein
MEKIAVISNAWQRILIANGPGYDLKKMPFIRQRYETFLRREISALTPFILHAAYTKSRTIIKLR